MKPRILFVDDEQNVLDGIADVLSRYRKVWDVDYFSSAAVALEALAKQPYDVIISDMRMPDISGAAVLQRVREISPSTVRILLSGQADPPSLIRSLSNVHHYLSKPCTSEALTQAIKRGVELRDMLASASRSALGSHSTLPADPNAYWELIRSIESDASPPRFGKILQNDPAMCVKTLQLANSAYFGSNQAVSSVPDAAQLLGSEWFRLMALSADVLTPFGSNDPAQRTCMAKLWDRARLVSRLAPALMPEGEQERTLARTAGILHTLGEQVVLLEQPDLYLEAFEVSTLQPNPVWRILRDTFEVDAASICVYLLSLWGLPQTVVDAVRALHGLGDLAPSSPTHHRALRKAFLEVTDD